MGEIEPGSRLLIVNNRSTPMTDKLIVLADLGRVKAFRVTRDILTSKPQVELVYDCEFPEAHGRVADKLTDQAGRFYSSGSNGASIRENNHLREENERRLIRLVAEKISDLVQAERCWYLAAGESINGRIVELLHPEARAVLFKNIPSDLVKTPKEQLLDHFAGAVA
jgi:hypothetical protein